MKAEFDRLKSVNTLWWISFYTAFISGWVFFTAFMMMYINELHGALIVVVISGILTMTAVVACVIISDSHGLITADDDGVTVVSVFFGKEIIRPKMEYDKIECAECDVKTVGTRYGGVLYKMFFTVKMKDGSEISVFEELNIESGLPASKPDEYKNYINQQPLMQLCRYINKMAERR